MKFVNLKVLLLAALVFVSACDKKTETPTEAPEPAKPSTVIAPPLDVGKVERVKVVADGFGTSAAEAVSEAMKMAILQVNGATIDTASISVKYGLDVTLGQDSASLRASEFAAAVIQRSGGAIQGFKVLELKEPGMLSKRYSVKIEAEIAKFEAPADLKKIKLVVATPRFTSNNINMGGRQVPASEVGAMLQQRINNGLAATGRFAMLDRDFSPEIEQELDMILDGSAPSSDFAKLSQAATADVILITQVNSFAYNRHSRHLKMADKELVSYSGGWSITQKLVNVATRQVLASTQLKGVAPSTAPTTLGSGVDSNGVLEGMSTDLVDQVVAAIVNATFPITVVSRDKDNVILSQGGKAIKPGARYAMVALGKELKDPQTGQSLGSVETPCCELVVDRVTANLAYGHLENVTSTDLDSLPDGALQVREQLKGSSSKGVDNAGSTPTTGGSKPRSGNGGNRAPSAPAAVPAPSNDDKW